MNHDELTTIIKAQLSMTAMKEWMEGRNIYNPQHPDFALTPLSRRLGLPRSKDVGSNRLLPFATLVFVPKMPLRPFWDMSDAAIFEWLKQPDRRYFPKMQYDLTACPVRAMHQGVILEYPSDRDEPSCHYYLTIAHTGVIEIGLGDVVRYPFNSGQNSERIFLHLTNLIGYVWYGIKLAKDFYNFYKQEGTFNLILNWRDSLNTGIGGFAHDWQDQFRMRLFNDSQCLHHHVQFRQDELSPQLTDDEIELLVRKLAFEVEAAWGRGGIGVFPRCFKIACTDNRPVLGEFDWSAFRG